MANDERSKRGYGRKAVAEKVAKAIRDVRKTMGLTQRQFADRVGLGGPGDEWKKISTYESGTVVPPLPNLEKIAQATGYPLSYFLGPSDCADLSDDERELLAAYRATDDDRLREITLDVALGNLRRSQALRGAENEEIQ